jgi:hypothetical protein
VTAYTYFYPLVTMDLTRKQLTYVAKVEGMNAPMSAFANHAAFPQADMKVVVRPNATRCIPVNGSTCGEPPQPIRGE